MDAVTQKCYKFVESPLPWDEAEGVCKEAGTHLVQVGLCCNIGGLYCNPGGVLILLQGVLIVLQGGLDCSKGGS